MLKMKTFSILFLFLFPGELVADGIKGDWKTELTDEGYYFYITIQTCEYSGLIGHPSIHGYSALNDTKLICGTIIKDKSYFPILNNTYNHLIMYDMKAGTFDSNKEWVEADSERISNRREFHGYIDNPLTNKKYKSKVQLLDNDSLSIELLGWGYYFNKKKWVRISP